ncbi:MAG: hypothetical protein GY729_07085 [Desulfobacteraceae bacterium]|nr:hypothetical protein [Desulfobacteraceae bacterium]
MKKVKCRKYHHYGNSFIILDETYEIQVPENHKQQFTKQILNTDIGLGADGLISLCSPLSHDIQINGAVADLIEETDFIFRHFEPDGSESLMCLNGVLITALFVSQILNKNDFLVLTATNAIHPQRLRAGIDLNGYAFVQGLKTEKVDACLVNPSAIVPHSPDIDKITPIKIQLRKNEEMGLPLIASAIEIWGYLIFSGEPHLVIFTDHLSDGPFFTDLLFQNPPQNHRIAAIDKLINLIGIRIQTDFVHLFPKGLNITFANIMAPGNHSKTLLQYRCFERAINKETQSCGTAALACFAVAEALDMIEPENTLVFPHLFNRNRPNSFYSIEKDTQAPHLWKITGQPEQISNGLYFRGPSE